MRKISYFLLLLFIALRSDAKEGMWIPTLLHAVEDDMQAFGLKLSADDIYSINHSSLKDAVVHFGGGCTAELISGEGLLLTNHHCGYGQIQSHSSLEHDYLKNGFWAMSRSEELANPGLTATFIVRIEEVTARMLKGLDANMDETQIAEILRNNQSIVERLAKEGTSYQAAVRAFNNGNQYFVIVTEVFEDVRLVGAPPSAVGKFGGDTDNWVWPRHTGDFSMFRIYAGPDNQPAAYNIDNQPYVPKHFFPVSLNGVKEGDFSMVFGFPGTTEQHLISGEVAYRMQEENPMKIAMRTASLGIIDAAMLSSDQLRIQYAAKQSRLSNAHKKWIGQNHGLYKMNALKVKTDFETEYVRRAKSQPDWANYAGLVDELNALQKAHAPVAFAFQNFLEYYYYGPELMRYARNFKEMVSDYKKMKEAGALDEKLEELKSVTASFFKDYNAAVDRKIFESLSALYLLYTPESLQAEYIKQASKQSKFDMAVFSARLYQSSFASEKAMIALLASPSEKSFSKLAKDPAYILMNDLLTVYSTSIRPEMARQEDQIDRQMTEYVKGMQLMFPEKVFWADANGTLRLTYGKVEGSVPRDGMSYQYYSTSEGILEKYDPENPDYQLPADLVALLEKGDFGVYGSDGELRVCFLGSNHTTGGNSGSPALNADGHLVGLNFDRTWESTMSDILFDPQQCRNIMVDARYILFIIDKYAGAGHLLNEMTLIKGTPELPEMDPLMQMEEMN